MQTGYRHTQTSNRARSWARLLFLWLLLAAAGPAAALETGSLRGPESGLVATAQIESLDPSKYPLRSAMMNGVRFFQRWISPIDGPRCTFSPTCSQFAHEAVRDHGPFLGVVMTADRLMRCTYWTEAGADYARLPNGALKDPVGENLLNPP